MRRFLLAIWIAAFVCAIGAGAKIWQQETQAQESAVTTAEFRAIELPTSATLDPQPLRRIETAPNGGIPIMQPGAVLQHTEYRGYTGPGVDGRCVMVFVPKVLLFDDLFVSGNDDPLGFVGNCRGSMVIKCQFPPNWKGSKAIIGYTNPTASNRPGPIYGRADGYAASIISNYCGGGAVRLADGVYDIRQNVFVCNALYGIDLLDARCDVIDNDFIAIEEKPADAPYWMQRNKDGTVHPCCIRITANVNGAQGASPHKSRLYCANNRLRTFKTVADAEAWLADWKAQMAGEAIAMRNIPHTVVAADGPMLVRSFPTDASRKAGWTAYQPSGQGVPREVFLRTPN